MCKGSFMKIVDLAKRVLQSPKTQALGSARTTATRGTIIIGLLSFLNIY